MSYYSVAEMETELKSNVEFQKYLYIRGFLFTDSGVNYNLDEYPFYGNWKIQSVCNNYRIYINKYTNYYCVSKNSITILLVGHAYNPFDMEYDEDKILNNMLDKFVESEKTFWEYESELTGVFALILIRNGNVIFSTDCTGMQLVYHGVVNNSLFLTSHSKLVADLNGLNQDPYINKLVNDRLFHYWGTWLPGDLSPFKELHRMQPNCCGEYFCDSSKIFVRRYYPNYKVSEVSDEKSYESIIHELGRIMHNNMELITKKWPDKKVSLSVTGGRDSMTALSCANGLYDKLNYFSYISNYDESIDAYAAKEICGKLGLNHELYEIPEESSIYENIKVFKKVMECNAGCIGSNNINDLKKRLYFCRNPKFDIEIKSWVNEMGRGWYYNKYNKKVFPKRPSPSYWRAMHKVYLNPFLIHKTDMVFKDYLNKYYDENTFNNISWLELYFWEFAWSGGEGVFLTSEHRVSYDITIPFNNRKYIELMLTAPLKKRINDDIPKDLIAYMNKNIIDCGIVVHDVSHTNLRAIIVRTYLEIMSKIKF